jgi:hypothetical protein
MTIEDRPTSDQRDQLAATDTRPPETTILTVPTGAANTGYAYHDSGDDGEPLCGAGDPETEFVPVTIAEAHHRNKSPCQMCRRLRE